MKLHNLLRRLELTATVINKTSKEKFSRIDNDPLGAKEHACELFLERARESIEKIEFVTEKKTWQSLQNRD